MAQPLHFQGKSLGGLRGVSRDAGSWMVTSGKHRIEPRATPEEDLKASSPRRALVPWPLPCQEAKKKLPFLKVVWKHRPRRHPKPPDAHPYGPSGLNSSDAGRGEQRTGAPHQHHEPGLQAAQNKPPQRQEARRPQQQLPGRPREHHSPGP